MRNPKKRVNFSSLCDRRWEWLHATHIVVVHSMLLHFWFPYTIRLCCCIESIIILKNGKHRWQDEKVRHSVLSSHHSAVYDIKLLDHSRVHDHFHPLACTPSRIPCHFKRVKESPRSSQVRVHPHLHLFLLLVPFLSLHSSLFGHQNPLTGLL